MTDAAGRFERHRAELFGLAYRMLGSVAEAEDVVQDAWLRWQEVEREKVENPRAYLSAIATRLCLDRLKSARQRREIYVGPWLPEPLLEDPSLISLPDEETSQDVSVALMLALERLSPLERAVFILHDVFEMGFDEVAKALGRSEAACRQLASRARASIHAARPRFAVRPDEGDSIAQAFFAASRSGDTSALRSLLAEAAVLHTDGGGRKRAALNLIGGAEKVCRFFAGLARKKRLQPVWSRQLLINGLPGIATMEADGTLQTMALEIEAGRIRAIYVVRNPDKLKHVAALLPPWLRPGMDAIDLPGRA